MLTIRYQTTFRRDFKRIKKRGYDTRLILEIIDKLAKEEPLEKKHRDHALTGDMVGFRECHIAPDWLLIYRIDNDNLILFLTRTGTHSDVLDM